MRFQAKLITIYAVFMLVAAIAIGLLLYRYSVGEFVDKELDRIESISVQTSNQLLETVDLMKYRSDTLLAEPSTLNSLRLLSRQKNVSEEYIRDARNTLQKSLITDSVMSKFYRVIIFNESDDIISTKTVSTSRVKAVVDWGAMPWIEKINASKGKPLLVAAHEDIWGVKDNKQVFSLVRAVQGSGMGYIEVSQTIDALEQLVRLPDEQLEVIILVNDSEIVYTNIPQFSDQPYKSIITDEGFMSGVRNIEGHGDKLISKTQANIYGLSVMVMKPESRIEEENRYLLTLVIFVVVLFYLISLGFIVMLSFFLTRPLRQLREVMEKTELSTIDSNAVIDVPNDEIMALSLTYQNVLERLKMTLEEEKQILRLQMEAQYDLLQAQINPHFLFNVLNVISNKGLINNDESICEICGNLADMLRYSTNVKDKYASIESEIDYVEQYLNILRSRFEHKLEFNVVCDPLMKNKMIPKITIQQFVENSINHAFKNTSRVMKIDILGSVTIDGWSIVIKDNGCGFSEKAIDDFNGQFAVIKDKISNSTDNIELEIGGLGLANTFARMYLLYGERFNLLIDNNDLGARVEIVVKEQEGQSYV